ncbi:hypothetical protein CHUAL_006947 [Chamberlinius hualienensis]
MLSIKLTVAVLLGLCCCVYGAPQGILSQQVRLPNLDSAHIQVQRLGGNFAYSVADSGPVHGLVHYAAVPTVQIVPIAPVGVANAAQQQQPVPQPQPQPQQQQFAAQPQVHFG